HGGDLSQRRGCDTRGRDANRGGAVSPLAPGVEADIRETAMLAAIEAFGDMLRVEQNASPHTARNYTSDLRQLRQFLLDHTLCRDAAGGEIDVKSIDAAVIRAYVAWLLQGRRKSSVGRKIS